MQTNQQLRRLRKLIKHLEHIERDEPDVFDLASWFKGPSSALTQWRENHKQRKPLNCGTTACMVGHMAVIFKEFTWRNQDVYFVASGECLDATNLPEFLGGTRSVWQFIIYDTHYPQAAQEPLLPHVLARLRLVHDSLDLRSDEFLLELSNTYADELTN
jgi:hypothetical protein